MAVGDAFGEVWSPACSRLTAFFADRGDFEVSPPPGLEAGGVIPAFLPPFFFEDGVDGLDGAVVSRRLARSGDVMVRGDGRLAFIFASRSAFSRLA